MGNPLEPRPRTRTVFADRTETRKNNFDFLRFFLAVVVIYTHSAWLSGHTYTSWQGRLTHGQFGGAWIAVDFFFVISGFLITQSWLRSRGTADYLKRRALRIYPGFAAALLFCVAVVGPLGGARLNTYFRDPATYAFFRPLLLGEMTNLPGVFAGGPVPWAVNGSLWTIRLEIFCYLLVVALGLSRVFKRRGAVLSLFVLALAFDLAKRSQWPSRWVLWYPYFGNLWELPRFLVFFLAGITFYLFRDVIPYSRVLLAVCVAGICLGGGRALQLTLPVFGTYIVFYVAFSRALRLSDFARRGDLSYGLYLYAFPVQQLLARRLPTGPIGLTLVSFPVTLALAAMSWRFVESPFLTMKRPGTNTRHDAPPVLPIEALATAPLPSA